MPIYSSNLALKKSALEIKDLPTPKKKRRLHSCLFKNNTRLQNIYAGKSKVIGSVEYLKRFELPIYPIDPSTGQPIINPSTGLPVQDGTRVVYKRERVASSGGEVVQIQKSLAVVIAAIKQREKNNPNRPFKSYSTQQPIQITGEYNEETEALIKELQAYVGIEDDGLIGEDTLSALDNLLQEIKYYDCETGQLGHDASVCEDKLTVTVAYKSANVHTLPDIQSPTIVTLDPANPEKRKVYIIQDINNSVPGWLYVQFDMPRGSTAKTTFGYVNASKIWKTSMPDGGAKLHKIITNDSVYELIKQNYYTYNSGSGEYENDLGHELRSSTSFFGWYNTVEYNQFKFYVNLLLVANNPGRINYDSQQVIYLTYSGAIEIDLDDIDNINPFDNPSSSTPNYDYFVEELKQSNNNYDWQTWEEDDTIILIASDPTGTPNGTNRYIWIPSKDFADRLYSYLNNNESFLANAHNNIRNAIIDNWPRGYGVEIKGSIGVTFGIPVHLEGGGSIHLYRKYSVLNNEVVLCLRKYGTVQGGLDIGIGAGFHLGSGKKSNSGQQLGAQIRAQAQAGVELEIFTEYEFPLWDPLSWSNAGRRDLGSLALFISLIDIGVGVLEFAAVQFAKAFTDYNIDPMNYLTRCEVKMTGFVRGQASGIVGLKMGDSNSVNYWDNNSQTSSHKDPPWHLKKILGMMNVSAGLSAGAEVATGFEYTAVYDDVCFDKKSGGRVPLTFSLSMSTDFQYLFDAGASLGPLNLGNFSLSPYMGIKLGIIYERPDLVNPGASESIIMIPDYNNLKYNGNPFVEIFAGDGNWDFYENSATEFGIRLKTNFGTPSSSATVLDQIDYLYIKKRFRLVSFSNAALQNVQALQNQMRNFFQKSKYKKFGLGAGAFLDFEGRLDPSFIPAIYNDLIELLDQLSIEIAAVQMVPVASVSWWKVLIDLPNYMNTFTSPGVNKKFRKLCDDLSASFSINNFSFHGELSFGGAIGFQLAAGFKAALNAQASLSITYDQQFINDDALIIPDDQLALANELNGYLTNPEMRKALFIFSGV